jgi:hypothetical protein
MRTVPALAALAAALILPATAGAATVGTTIVFPPVTSNAQGAAQAYRFTAESSGPVDRLSIYLDGTSTADEVEVGLYSGSASSAGTLRARCVISSPQPNAWNRCTFTGYSLTAGAYYWLALLQPSSSNGSMRYREGQLFGGPTTYLSESKSLSSLPSSWTSGASWTGGYTASIYADEAGDSLPPPTPSPTPTPPPAPADSDGDGIPDSSDQCPGTPAGTPIDGNGCPTPPLPLPPSSGFPDTSNTGVPVGTVLRQTGGLIVKTAGTVISGVDAPWMSVEAPNVTIRNSRIGGGTESMPIVNRSTGLLVEDTTILGKDGTGIMFDNYTARRVEVTGTENGFQAGNNTTIVDSWIHDLDTSAGAHTDGIQFSPGAGNVVIRHNTIVPQSSGGAASTSAIIMHTGSGAQNHDVWIENNRLDGSHASVALYCPRQTASNIFINSNQMLKGVYGSYTDSCSVPDHVTEFDGNTDWNTGAAVRAGG